MLRATQKTPLVLFPEISVDSPGSPPSSLSQSSARSGVRPTPIYSNAFLDSLRKLHQEYTQTSAEILVPDSRPPTPNAEHRVRRLADAMQKSLDESQHVMPGAINLLCIQYHASQSTIHPPSIHSRVTTSSEQGPGESQSDIASLLPLLTREDAKRFESQRLGHIPVAAAHTHDPEVSSQARKRKLLHSHDEARPASNLPFRAVKRLKAEHAKGPLENTPIRSLSRSTIDVDDAPLSPTQAAASQELSLRIEPATLRSRSPLDVTFNLDTSIVSLFMELYPKIPNKSVLLSPQIFDPVHTSTPTRPAFPTKSEHPTSSLEKIGLRVSPTPRRTRAAEYREKVATPIADVATLQLDSRAVQRVPTLTDLMKSSAKSRRDRQDTKRRKPASLDSSQASQMQSQAQSSQEEHPAPIPAPSFNPPLDNPSTPSENKTLPVAAGATFADGRANMISPGPSFFGEQNLTASARKRKTFGSVLSLGSLGFSSQFDVESNVDDISRFMKDDVDDVFL